jgi:hypothetical protein
MQLNCEHRDGEAENEKARFQAVLEASITRNCRLVSGAGEELTESKVAVVDAVISLTLRAHRK